MKLTVAVAVVVLASASACGKTAPESPPPAAVASAEPKNACAMVDAAHDAAAAALGPVAAVLAGGEVPAGDLAKATEEIRTTFTAMHIAVAAAAESASDPGLKEKIFEYQYWVEQAIVVVEGADEGAGELTRAIELPELRDAYAAVKALCA